MAHNLEIINGKASAAFVVTGTGDRQVPWHHLGTYVDKAMTAEEALELANLNWDVRLVPLMTVEWTNVPARVAVVRDTEQGAEVLGLVGEGYTPIQNREAFTVCDDLVQASGEAHYETAGMLRAPMTKPVAPGAPSVPGIGGSVFITLSRPDLVLDASGRADTHARYLLCVNGFDGSKAFTLKMTNVRVVCKNTQELALKRAGNQFKVAHTRNVLARMGQAREALGLVQNFDETFMAQAEALLRAEASIEGKAFSQVMDAAFGGIKADASDLQKRRHAERLENLQTIALAPHNENIRGTLWGAYNVVTEYLDWARPSRSKDIAQVATQTLTSPTVLGAKSRAFASAAQLLSV